MLIFGQHFTKDTVATQCVFKMFTLLARPTKHRDSKYAVAFLFRQRNNTIQPVQ